MTFELIILIVFGLISVALVLMAGVLMYKEFFHEDKDED